MSYAAALTTAYRPGSAPILTPRTRFSGLFNFVIYKYKVGRLKPKFFILVHKLVATVTQNRSLITQLENRWNQFCLIFDRFIVLWPLMTCKIFFGMQRET